MIFFNFLNDEKVYFDCFNFLISDYGYNITYKDTDKGIHYSKIILEKSNSPKIEIVIEKGYLDLLLFIDEEKWNICMLYKFLHHDKIVRMKYGNSKVIQKEFEVNTRKYLDEVLEKRNSITNMQLHSFYKEFPGYVFVWS